MTAPARQRHATLHATPVRPLSTRARRARGADLIACDHLPACPACGDLAGLGVTVCASCGAQLFPTQSNDRLDTSLRGASKPAVN